MKVSTDTGYKIYQNPSRRDIRHIFENSFVVQQMAGMNDQEKSDYIQDDEVEYDGEETCNVHGVEYPLRGWVVNGTAYVVDSFDVDHDDFVNELPSRKEGQDRIAFTVEFRKKHQGYDPDGIAIGISDQSVQEATSHKMLTRMKLPFQKW